MFFKNQLVLILSLFISTILTQAEAANPIILQRFEKPLSILEDTFTPGESLETLLKNLTQGRRRVAVFNLQALAQIYQKYPTDNARSFFKDTLRFEAKSLEDSIGLIDKWAVITKFYQDQNISSEKLNQAQENLEQAWLILEWVVTGQENDLKNRNLSEDSLLLYNRYSEGKKLSLYKDLFWVGDKNNIIQQLKSDLRSYTWLNDQEDRAYVLEALQDQLKETQKITFNFNLLEDTESEKGLHEFRREIRWFSFQANNLDGLVQLKELNSCPTENLHKEFINLYYPQLKNSPYAKLPKSTLLNESQICRISPCLFYKLSSIVSEVGALKDEVEKINHLEDLHNKTPLETAQKAAEIHADLLTSNTLDLLRDEIKACY